MFQFPEYIFFSECFAACYKLGNLGIKGCLHLPRAFRSLPRPLSQLKPSYPSNSIKKSSNFNSMKSLED